jgi:hypothetical protein
VVAEEMMSGIVRETLLNNQEAWNEKGKMPAERKPKLCTEKSIGMNRLFESKHFGSGQFMNL